MKFKLPTHRWNLRWILFFHLGFVALAMVSAMSVANYYLMKNYLHQSAAGDLFPVLKSVEDTVGTTVSQYENQIRQFITFADLGRYLSDVDTSNPLPASVSGSKTHLLMEKIDQFNQSMNNQQTQVVSDIHLITRDGNRIGNNKVEMMASRELAQIENYSYTDSLYLDEMRHVESQGYISTMYFQIHNANKDVVGWIKATVSLTELLRQSLLSYSSAPLPPEANGNLVPSMPIPPSSLRLTFLTKSGSQLYSSDSNQFSESLIRSILSSYQTNPMMGFLRVGDEFYAYRSGRNDRIDLNWILVMSQPVGMALRQAGTMVLANIAVIGIGITVIASLMGFLLDIFVVKPTRKMAAMAQQIAGGNFNVAMDRQRTIELDLLADRFNDMAAELKQRQLNIVGLNSQLKILNATLRHDILNRLIYIGGSVKNYVDYTSDAVSVSLRELLDAINSVVKSSVEFIEHMKEAEEEMGPCCPTKQYRIGEIVQQVARQMVMGLEINGEADVLADHVVESVVGNILSNAKRHGQVDKVKVQIIPDGDMVDVRIADEGKGIPDDIKTQLFIKGHAFGETGHTGEGLYVSKMTMERYGGSIRIEDNHPRGTVFVLRFRTGVKK